MLAGRHREALRLLSAVHLSLDDGGRRDVVRATIQALPVDAYATDFAATLEFTWCQLLVDRGRFLDGVTRLSWWAQRSAVSGVLAARLTLLQSVAATVSGDWAEGGRLARQSMAELGPEWLLDSFGRLGFNMVALDVALSERWHDDDEDVRRADFELVQDPVGGVSFEGVRALGEALAGHPLAALQTVGGVREFASVTNMAIVDGELRLAELVARREVGDRDGVVEALGELGTTDVAPTTYIRVRALAELVAAHLDDGAIDSARSTLDTLRRSLDRTMSGGGVRTLVARCAADVALAAGEIDDAERWIGEIDDPFWHHVGRAPDPTAASRPRRGARRLGRRRRPVQQARRGARPAAVGHRRRARGGAQVRHRRGRDRRGARHGPDRGDTGRGGGGTRRALRLAGASRMARSSAPGLRAGIGDRPRRSFATGRHRTADRPRA